MSWLYKSKGKIGGGKPELNEILPICPKCHYILQSRPGERPIYCPMCGEKNLVEKEKNVEAKPKRTRKAKGE